MSHLSLVAFDDFTPRAEEIREKALQLSFDPVEWNGHVYKNIGLGYDPDLQLQIEKAVGGPITPVMQYFRLEGAGDGSTAWIHADTSIRATFASVLYLSHPPGPLQGTAFWTHKGLNLDGVPAGTTEQQNEWVAKYGPELRADAHSDENWILNGVVPMKFNRFVMYPTRVFHSRYPKESFGDAKQDRRLIFVCFFNPGRH